MSALESGPVTAQELPVIVGLFDREFMAARGRTGSVVTHYPDLFQATNAANLLVLRQEGEPVSFCALQNFSIHLGDVVYRGGMIGFVCTHPSRRGQGLAKRLLAEAEAVMKNRDLDFAVLFAARPEFYQTQGWTLRDNGLAGVFRRNDGSISPSPGGENPILEDSISLMENIRKTETLRVDRTPFLYRRRPLAAESLSAIFSPNREAFALVGCAGDRRYLYELSGAETSFEPIWNIVTESGREVILNSHASASSLSWLKSKPGIVWRDQTQSLWKWFRPADLTPNLTLEHVPYFDRI